MLKGWTLTDLQCDVCHVTPLMREPAAVASAERRDQVQFCALCDGSPAARSDPVQFVQSGGDPADSISKLLLKGYSLLNSNCSNAECRGIPLVGYPRKKDGTKDSRRMCVSCGKSWDGKRSEASESPRSRKRRELYEEGERIKLEAEAEDMDLEEGSAPVPPPKELPTTTALANTSTSLALTLDRLAESLKRHTITEERYFVDVKLHTEAIKDVLEVMKMVEKF